MTMIECLRPDWPAPPGVMAASTTRGGGVSTGPWASLNLGAHVGDDPRCVAGNRARLAEALRLPGDPVWLNQVHGAVVATLRGGEANIDADAAFTRDAGVVCTVMTADCLPVLFADCRGGAVAAAHAGWRGLAAGVLEASLACFDDPSRVLAWLGPAIGPAAFEVGDEVRAAFVARDAATQGAFRPHGPGRWLADIYQLARQRLARAGLSRVYGGGRCTFSEKARFFSYRRDGITGRMASLIWIEAGVADE
jgi:YfiH family protein